MIHTKTDDKAFTGLEAAIVLIAFVVVAAVFSYVVLGAGFFTTQKAQEAVYTAVAQSTSNIQMVGQVYGLSSDSSNINQIQFTIGLAPGSPVLDLTFMKVIFSTPSTPIKTLSYGPTASTSVFTAKDGLNLAPTLSPQQQVQINFLVDGVPKNTIINMELHPAVGAALPFEKTTPPQIFGTNVLY